MKNIMLIALMFLAFVAVSANAEIVKTEESGPVQAFADDVSNDDLLAGLTAVTVGWNISNDAHPSELTDGISGANYVEVPGDAVQGAWTTVGAAAEYHLGTGSNGLGYDITSILSIADWVNVGFGNQAWTVEVKPVGGSYVTLASVDCQLLGSNGGGATKVNLTDSAGIIASGIEYIKFTANMVNNGANSGAFVWREVDVIGTATVPVADTDSDGLPDSFELLYTDPPSIIALNPDDDLEHNGSGDGLTNLQVFHYGTNPDNPDTDGDTLEDGDEVIGAGQRPVTSPIKPDTDNDGINDNIETNSGIFVNAADTGTDPTKVDSDIDGINDGAEVAAGTNPLDSFDPPRPIRIMCVGDSITAGYTDNPSWDNHPFMFGYRSGLYTRLNDAGYNFKLVGQSPQPWDLTSGDPTKGGTYVPALDLRDFEQDGHRGYGGWNINGINNGIAGWIAVDNPDVILLLIGINGINTESKVLLTNLVDNIVKTAPEAYLIVAQITPYANFNQLLYDYNVYIRDSLVPTYAEQGYKISTVDLYSLFLVDPDNYSSAIKAGILANNINHPNNEYYDMMAQRWFDGLMHITKIFNGKAPSVNAGKDIVTWSGEAVSLTPVIIEQPDSNWTELSYQWSAEPADSVEFVDSSQFDLAPKVMFDKASENPSVVTMTLTVSSPGKVSVADTMTIDVYENACKAAVGIDSAAAQLTDIAGEDCTTNMLDFALLAFNWLGNTSLTNPVAKD